MINIDNSSNKPIYEQIYQEFIKLILSNKLKPDDKLPSVRELANITKINPNTIQRAYKELENDKYIYTIKGKGNFVKKGEGIIDAHVKKQEEKLRIVVKSLKELSLSQDEIIKMVNNILSE